MVLSKTVRAKESVRPAIFSGEKKSGRKFRIVVSLLSSFNLRLGQEHWRVITLIKLHRPAISFRNNEIGT